MVKTAIALGLGLAAVAAAPAWAEHNTLVVPAAEQPAKEPTLDFDLKIGADGFRLGTRLFGDTFHGAWLNGQMLPGGFSLDGRVESDGRAHNFKVNVEVLDFLRRWWLAAP